MLDGKNVYAEVYHGALTYVPAELDYERVAVKDKFLVVDFISYGAKHYVIQKRMDYATTLLGSGYHSLKEIAYMCGYSDYKYFSAEFKKATGRSPSGYVNEV